MYGGLKLFARTPSLRRRHSTSGGSCHIYKNQDQNTGVNRRIGLSRSRTGLWLLGMFQLEHGQVANQRSAIFQVFERRADGIPAIISFRCNGIFSNFARGLKMADFSLLGLANL